MVVCSYFSILTFSMSRFAEVNPMGSYFTFSLFFASPWDKFSFIISFFNFCLLISFFLIAYMYFLFYTQHRLPEWAPSNLRNDFYFSHLDSWTHLYQLIWYNIPFEPTIHHGFKNRPSHHESDCYGFSAPTLFISQFLFEEALEGSQRHFALILKNQYHIF